MNKSARSNPHPLALTAAKEIIISHHSIILKYLVLFLNEGTYALKRRAGSGRCYNICTQDLDSIHSQGMIYYFHPQTDLRML